VVYAKEIGEEGGEEDVVGMFEGKLGFCRIDLIHESSHLNHRSRMLRNCSGLPLSTLQSITLEEVLHTSTEIPPEFWKPVM